MVSLFNSFLFFAILGILWFFFIINRAHQKSLKKRDRDRNLAQDWGTEACFCGTPRHRWKAMAMERLEHLVLLRCPECGQLWEEKMNAYGNKWRSVEPEYVRKRYDFDQDGD